MFKYYIETYGCQMNIYDSELVAGLLEKCGYHETKEISDADAIFLNTCAIREKAEETVHNKLSNIQYLKNNKPEMIFGVLGCMAQNLKPFFNKAAKRRNSKNCYFHIIKNLLNFIFIKFIPSCLIM